MKLLSIAIPCYNSAAYMAKAIESLLPGGDEVEILIVNDGSTKDNTAEIADEYARKYPGICYAIHKENGGHGDAVMTGLQHATGLYFKVVDSDDWVDEEAYPRVLDTLRSLSAPEKQIDLLISNYIYDKVGVKHKHVVRYASALKENQVMTWKDAGNFHLGQYILMHAAIYRTQMLRDSGLTLPKHTFYVDSLYVYVPMKNVEKLYYLNADLYHYFIGREDQSVQEKVMISRMDQQIRVNKLMLDEVDLTQVKDKPRFKYMLSYLEIITTVTNVLAVKSGTEEHLRMKDELWAYIKEKNPVIYRKLRWSLLGIATHLPGKMGRRLLMRCYAISRKAIGFN